LRDGSGRDLTLTKNLWFSFFWHETVYIVKQVTLFLSKVFIV
jgi:hypothetical protein